MASKPSSSVFTTASSPLHLHRVLPLIVRKSKSALGELDNAALYEAIHTTLSQTIIARVSTTTPRRPGTALHITQDELLRILRFKLAFGVNRPALLSFIQKLPNDLVVSASRLSFECLRRTEGWEGGLSKKDVTDAFTAMTVLKGVGPATASLVLSLVSEDVPFYSDEVAEKLLRMEEGQGGGDGKSGKKKVSLKYTPAEYWMYVERIDKARAGSGEGRRTWERRMWVEEMWKAKGDGSLLEGEVARRSSGMVQDGEGKPGEAQDAQEGGQEHVEGNKKRKAATEEASEAGQTKKGKSE